MLSALTSNSGIVSHLSDGLDEGQNPNRHVSQRLGSIGAGALAVYFICTTSNVKLPINAASLLEKCAVVTMASMSNHSDTSMTNQFRMSLMPWIEVTRGR